jgi:hypothetical protein
MAHPSASPEARSLARRAKAPVVATLLATLALSCSADGAAHAEAEIVGSARDADTDEPIAGAWIFEVHREPGLGADVLHVDHVRTTRTDAEGRFTFEAERSGLGLGRRYAPIYHFFHPSYGLLKSRATDEGRRVSFRPSLRDAHLRLADATAFCRDPAVDAMAEKMRKLACPPARTARFADGRPRARGPLDDRGRRDGEWTFFREDGSVIARGHYRAGAAVGRWTFEAPAEPPGRGGVDERD